MGVLEKEKHCSEIFLQVGIDISVKNYDRNPGSNCKIFK